MLILWQKSAFQITKLQKHQNNQTPTGTSQKKPRKQSEPNWCKPKETTKEKPQDQPEQKLPKQ